MWSSQSSSSHSIKKCGNDSSADDSVKELTSDEEDDDPPTPVNEILDESGWNEATDEPQSDSGNNRKLSNEEVRENHKAAQRFMGPQHSCCHCFNGGFDEWRSTSRVFHMQETTNRFPPILAKRNYRACDHCGLTFSPVYLEPMAHPYWDCPPHHHSLHPGFHLRKV